MKETTQVVKVRISGDSSDRESVSSEGTLRVQFWDKKERTLRALKFGGMCWGAALVCIIIPLLHFILVPSLLLAGPILAFYVMGQESVVLGGEGVCPHCQDALPIARTSYRFPISDTCTRCLNYIKITAL